MGHYYTAAGEPQHYQKIKSGVNKGKLRDTNIRDARKLDLRPSVTGILDVLDKGGGLTNWKVQEAMKTFKLDVWEWLKMPTLQTAFTTKFNVDLLYKKRDYAAEGSVIHDYIEKWIDDPTRELDPVAQQYVGSVKDVFRTFDVDNPVAEQTFATKDYGGAVDCHDKTANIIIDYKTKAIKGKEGKDFAFESYCMQLVAYRDGLNMPRGTRLVNLFLCRDDPNKYCYYEWDEKTITKAEEMFSLCLQIYKLKNSI